ncbi:putrescine importer [Scopulibacillus darangshiensis]|uniref:Putrescine importer n=1 Tax=Scopulibacillus darangshiensis TaxID=442528 RepID=A0A4R2P6X3_9BACL|nr:putrescine importer [Scopulibacillus darangshiensis]
MTLGPVVLFGLAYMAPMTVFSTYGVGVETSKGLLPVAYLFTVITMFFTANSYGLMAKTFPLAGSAYTYTQRTISTNIGFLVGWMTLLDYLLLPMINFLIAGLFLADAFPAIPADLWILLFIVGITVVNVLGIKLNTTINGLLLLYMAFVIVLFFILAIKAVVHGVGTGSLMSVTPFYNPDVSISSVLSGAALVGLSFLGFDAVTTVSEETVNPTKTIPRAILLTVIIGGGLFILVSYFAYLVHPDYSTFKNTDTAASEIASIIGGKLFSILFLAGILTSTTASALASHASASRLLYAMGRDHVISNKIFGYISPKFKTPVYNVVLIGLFSCSGLFLSLETATSLINFGAFIAFIFVNLSVISHFFIKKKQRSIRGTCLYLVFPLLGAVLTLVLWINLGFGSLSVGVTWFLIGFVYLLGITKFFSKKPPQFNFNENKGNVANNNLQTESY